MINHPAGTGAGTISHPVEWAAATINHPVEWAAAMINHPAGMEAVEEWEAATTNPQAGMEVGMTVRAGRVEARAEAWEVDNLADSQVGQEAWSQGLSRRECKLRKALLKRKDGSYTFKIGIPAFKGSRRVFLPSFHLPDLVPHRCTLSRNPGDSNP